MKRRSRLETFLWWLQCLAPAAVIAAPLLLVAFHFVHPSALAAHVRRATEFIRGAEQRAPNRRPDLPRSADEWAALPERINAWLDDMAPLREGLVTLHNRLKFTLGIAPNGKVVLGRDGWLFYGENAERDDVRRIARLTAAQKERWLAYLNRLSDETARRGATFLLVIAPDKSSVYPEFLPAALRDRSGPRRLDDLLAFLRARGCRAKVLDLRDELRARKGGEPLYFRTDTHWNERGAVLAADAIREALESAGALGPRKSPARKFVSFPRAGGDLRFPGGDPASEFAPRLKPRPRFERNPADPAREDFAAIFPDATSRQFTGSAGAGEELLMLHDSFGIGLIPLLGAEFRRAAYVFVGPRVPSVERVGAALEELRPRVVILERVERYFAEPPEE